MQEPESGLIPEGKTQLALYRGREIRKVFHEGEWWFSIVDVVGAITDSSRAGRYWNDLKRQLSGKEGFYELSANIGQLPLPSGDGKNRPKANQEYAPLWRCPLPFRLGGFSRSSRNADIEV